MDLPWNRRRHRPARADSRCDLAGRQEAKTIPIATSASKTGPEDGGNKKTLVSFLEKRLITIKKRSKLKLILSITWAYFRYVANEIRTPSS